LSYDRLTYPRNIDTSPITDAQATKDQVSPKVGLLWTPLPRTNVRGAYTRSLGGVFYDNSVRLEPTQVAGFNQAFRSLIPESAVGLVPGTRFETFGAGLDHTFKTRTYLGIEGEILRSDASRTVGVFTNGTFLPIPDSPSSTKQDLDFEEKTLMVTLNQLINEEWSLGARYRLSHADFTGRFGEIGPTAIGSGQVQQDEQAMLQQLNLFVIYNHRCGFFAQFDSLWTQQNNQGYSPDIPGDDFWQFNAYAGYRFLRRAAEARIGVLNLTDRDYRLNPLNLYSELPRERTFTASLRFYF
jgi:outer membrane receptor protein involved in Fe transport